MLKKLSLFTLIFALSSGTNLIMMGAANFADLNFGELGDLRPLTRREQKKRDAEQERQREIQEQKRLEEDRARRQAEAKAEEERYRQELKKEMQEHQILALASYKKYHADASPGANNNLGGNLIDGGSCLSDSQQQFVICESRIATVDSYIKKQQDKIEKCNKLRDSESRTLTDASQRLQKSAETRLSMACSTAQSLKKDFEALQIHRMHVAGWKGHIESRGIIARDCLEERTYIWDNIYQCNMYKTGSALAGLACAALAYKFRKSRPKTATLCAGLGVGFGCLYGLFRYMKNEWNKRL